MPAEDIAHLVGRRGRPYAVALGAGPEPSEIIARLGSPLPLAVLWGRWFGGGAVVLRDPLCWVTPEYAEDAFPYVDVEPELDRDGMDETLLAGGWLAQLGYAPHHSAVGFFDHLLRWQPARGWVFEALGLEGREGELERALDRARSLVAGASTAPTSSRPAFALSPFTSSPLAQETHLRGVEEVIGRIERGDFYQLNLCTRLRANLSGSVPAVFARGADRLRPTYGAMIDSGGGSSLISFSPELFLEVHRDQVRTAPIKGTSPTRDDPDGSGLARSRKDVAENIMITDLMRNDLSRVCRPGTVRVERLLDLQAHPGVWHLVSVVAGELMAGTSRADLLHATFPPGSVTGAPKISAQGGIATLEPEPRGAYTGALGFLTPAAGAEFSVIIRTFEVTGRQVELGVGGGITVDSAPVREWYECLDKARPLVQAVDADLAAELRSPPPPIPDALRDRGLFETLLSRDGTVLRLAAHLARLDRSCRELYGWSVPEDLAARVQQVADDGPRADRTRLRVQAVPGDGRMRITVEAWAAPPPPTSLRLIRRTRPAWSWRHKWAERTALGEADLIGVVASSDHQVWPYFLSPVGHLAETSRGNLCVLGSDDVWRTPPEDEHVLPGVTRRALLRVWTDLGRPYRIGHVAPGELRDARAVVSTSSISGLVLVDQVDDHRMAAPAGVLEELAEMSRRLGFG